MSTTFEVNDGDVVMNRTTGQPDLVSGRAKLRQDLRIALSTSAQQGNVGAGLEDVINGVAADPGLVGRLVEQRVRRMVDEIQRLQSRFRRIDRPLDERLERLRRVYAAPDANDPTSYRLRAEFTSADPAGNITLQGNLR